MKVGGYHKEVVYERLGPTLVIAASLILALRTADWTNPIADGLHNREWEAEIDRALKMAQTVLTHALAKWPEKFHRKDVPWFVPDETDSTP